MLRKSWRYIAVLLAMGRLASLTVGGALAAQPGNGKGNAKGPKNKGKIVHVNGTVTTPPGSTIMVQPKTAGKSGTRSGRPTTPQTFTVDPATTKIVGYGIQEGSTPSLAQVAGTGTRVNVVGRRPAGSADGTPVASIIVVLGPEDADEDQK